VNDGANVVQAEVIYIIFSHGQVGPFPGDARLQEHALRVIGWQARVYVVASLAILELFVEECHTFLLYCVVVQVDVS